MDEPAAGCRAGEGPPDGLSVVVPVFNSATILNDLVTEVSRVASSCDRRFEIILVDDGSADGSWAEICRLAAGDGTVRGVRLRRNYGQANATLCGICQARFAVTVTLDDDFQHPPDAIVDLLSTMDEGCDLVYGTPPTRVQSGWRNIASSLSRSLLALMTGRRQILYSSAFRAFRTDLRDAFPSFGGPSVVLDALLGRGASRICITPVAFARRVHGTSSYTFLKLVDRFLLVLMAYNPRAPTALRVTGGVMSGGGTAASVLALLAVGWPRPTVVVILSLSLLVAALGAAGLLIAARGRELNEAEARAERCEAYDIAHVTPGSRDLDFEVGDEAAGPPGGNP